MNKGKSKKGGVEIPKVRVDEETVRAARMLSPDFFGQLKGDARKVAVLTLKRGFLPMLANGPKAVDAICSMCSETQGKEYNPLRCMKECPMMKVAKQMEELYSSLNGALVHFFKEGHDKGDDNGGAGRRKSNGRKPDDGGDHDDKPSLVPA